MIKTKEYPPTPELDKMNSVKEKSQAIGEFIEQFLGDKGYSIGKPHKHDEHCPGWDNEGRQIRGETNGCCFHSGNMEFMREPLEKLLAEFFEIDLEKVEQERREILEFIRSRQ